LLIWGLCIGIVSVYILNKQLEALSKCFALVVLAGNGEPMLKYPNLFMSTIRTTLRDQEIANSLKGLPLGDPTLQQNQPKSKLHWYVLTVTIAVVGVSLCITLT